MADVTNGMRGSDSYPASQRPKNFGGGIKLNPNATRVSRKDVARRLRHRKGKRGKEKETE